MSDKPAVFLSAREFFQEVVEDALGRRQVKTFPLAQSYLVDLLSQYVSSDQLFGEAADGGSRKTETLAELLLKANQEERGVRIELLKKLGDVSLYVSGVFGDSLHRKVVDIDYYAEMGGLAYGSLASLVREDTFRAVYKDFSRRFLDYVDVLTLISQRVFIQNDENLLRLYERYIRTGSELAKDHLIEKGILPVEGTKGFKQ